jgi:hypothetical protein
MPRGVECMPVFAKQAGLPSGKVGRGHNEFPIGAQQTAQPVDGAEWVLEMLDLLKAFPQFVPAYVSEYTV